MSRPKLVLFDEPSLGLAPNIVERTFDIITAIRAYVLEQGRVTRTGSGKNLLNDPEVKKAYLGG
jgi:branched-chain amino acid transport system ATP-binding protein